MKKKFLAVLVVLFVSSMSFAGFTSFNCTFADDPSQALHNWNFDSTTKSLTLSENMYLLGYDSVGMEGASDSDPTFHVSKSVKNETGIAWTSYELTLLGTGATFDYTVAPTSSHFLSTTQTPTVLTFLAPYAVGPGATVTMNFDINVSTTGLFSFALQQNPIPEPATLAILGLGGMGLLRRRVR